MWDFISIFVSVVTILLFAFFIAPSVETAIIGTAALTLSNAFMEYSSSGLENPLTHLLIVLFMWVYSGQSSKKLFFLSLIASLAMLNRMDTILLFLPFIAVCFLKKASLKNAGVILLGFTPFVLWECFSLVYYGFLFPNTAYAKLGTGVAGIDLARQGIFYFSASLKKDPLTLTLIGSTLILICYFRKKDSIPFAIGILLYLVYIVRIGGCFMSGRFFSAPFLMATIALVFWVDSYLSSKKVIYVILSVIIILGFSTRTNTLLKTDQYGKGYNDPFPIVDHNGVVDEQMFYFQASSLLCYNKNTIPPYRIVYTKHDLKAIGEELKAKGAHISILRIIGVAGYFAGPDVHIIDPLALSDPLLARQPVMDTNEWRIGHFKRAIPQDYLQSVRHGTNLFKDKKTALLYEKLVLITSGPLFSSERWKAIMDLNFGRFIPALYSER